MWHIIFAIVWAFARANATIGGVAIAIMISNCDKPCQEGVGEGKCHHHHSTLSSPPSSSMPSPLLGQQQQQQQQQQQSEDAPPLDCAISEMRMARLESELNRVKELYRIQAKRNDINVNLFAVILNELSLKLNMKGRPKEVRNDDALPIGRHRICSLKHVRPISFNAANHGASTPSPGSKRRRRESDAVAPEPAFKTEMVSHEGSDTECKGAHDSAEAGCEGDAHRCHIDDDRDGEHMRIEESIIDNISVEVLEAAAISFSGQTVTSVDEKNLHRIKQIREFKLANLIPLNGLVCFKKNVTRFNQDAGLACNMTLQSKVVNGGNICFGTDEEHALVSTLCGNNDDTACLATKALTDAPHHAQPYANEGMDAFDRGPAVGDDDYGSVDDDSGGGGGGDDGDGGGGIGGDQSVTKVPSQHPDTLPTSTQVQTSPTAHTNADYRDCDIETNDSGNDDTDSDRYKEVLFDSEGLDTFCKTFTF